MLLDLAAQPANVDVHGPRIARVTRTPDAVEQIPDVDRANRAKYLTIAKLRLENAIAIVRRGEFGDRKRSPRTPAGASRSLTMRASRRKASIAAGVRVDAGEGPT